MKIISISSTVPKCPKCNSGKIKGRELGNIICECGHWYPDIWGYFKQIGK